MAISDSPPPCWQLILQCSPADAMVWIDALDGLVDALVTYEITEDVLWAVSGVIKGIPPKAELATHLALAALAADLAVPDYELQPIPYKDWLAEVYAGLPPIHADRFFIYGSHYDGQVPAGKIGLKVDAATAFGSGTHGSTYGCLLALSFLENLVKPRRVLDMGCGSGILALAMQKLWRVPTFAVDIDSEAVRVTRFNARINQARLQSAAGAGYATPLARQYAPYDVVCANILARPLVKMAPDLICQLRPGGYVILAGLLRRQENLVLHAHREQGLKLVRRWHQGEWSCLLLSSG